MIIGLNIKGKYDFILLLCVKFNWFFYNFIISCVFGDCIIFLYRVIV